MTKIETLFIIYTNTYGAPGPWDILPTDIVMPNKDIIRLEAEGLVKRSGSYGPSYTFVELTWKGLYFLFKYKFYNKEDKKNKS
jgi:hypothetical protein